MVEKFILEHWWNSHNPEEISCGEMDLESLRFWFNLRRKDVAEEIETVKIFVEELGEKSFDEIKEISSKYEFPEFPKVGPPRNNCLGYPQPLDDSSRSRSLEATTCNCCGWCRYCKKEGGVVSPYGFGIKATCALIPESLSEASVRFDTPCVILKNNEEYWEACKEYLRFKLVKLEAENSMLDVYAKNIE